MENKVLCPGCGKPLKIEPMYLTDWKHYTGKERWFCMPECKNKGCDAGWHTRPILEMTEEKAMKKAVSAASRRTYPEIDLRNIAAAVHNAWREEKKRQGITDHPDMVPYDQLSEAAKEYDRATAKAVLRAIGGYVK